jgi:hypothetical protein
LLDAGALIDEKLLGGCLDEAPACMARIREDLALDVLVYGHLTAGGASYTVDVHGLHVATRIVHSWSGSASPVESTLVAAARAAYPAVVGRVE